MLLHGGGELNVTMSRTGADVEAVVVSDSVELGDTRQADDDLGHQQALAHHYDQRGAAGDDTRVFAMPFHQTEGFLKSCRFVVVKLDHDPFFSLRARRIFSGVIGNVLTRTPTASKIALLITAAVGSILSSPNPLAPTGPVGSNESAKACRSGGISRMDGIR